jgi:outer membrane protein assembly factor BamB
MKNTLSACVIFLLSVLATCVAFSQSSPDVGEEPEFRIWTDTTGQFETEAAMISLLDDVVLLRKRDGSEISVALSLLSPIDQRYARTEQRRRDAPPPPEDPEIELPAETETDANVDWPGWRGPTRNGRSPDVGLLKSWPEGGPPLLWEVDDIGEGYSNVAVVDGNVYTAGVIDERLCVFAIDSEGDRLGRFEHGPAFMDSNYDGSRSTPTISDGKLYIMSGRGFVGCYDASNGERIWTVDMVRDFGGSIPTWGYSESVLIIGELAVIAPGGNSVIVALDKDTGRPVWWTEEVSAAAQYGSCYAFIHDGVPMIALGTAEGLLCIDARNGRVLWTNPFSARNTANCPTPVYSNGYVFWANGYEKGGICMRLAVINGNVRAEEAWRTSDMDCRVGAYIIHEGYVYGTNAGGWACLDLRTGEPQWTDRGAVGTGSLCYADEMLYLFGESGGRMALGTCSPEGLEITGEHRVEGTRQSWAHPVVIGGRLYIRYDRNLYCFDVKARE